MNKAVAEPQLADLLILFKKEIMISLNCHAVGTVEVFNPANQTVQVSINYKKSVNGVAVNYPVVVDCPVVMMAGGGGVLTFPIQKGDTCLILFNDRAIDDWFQSGNVGPLPNERMHSFSDGIALIGLRSLQNKLSDYDETRVALKNGTAMIGVGPTLLKLSNDTTDLKTLINGLIDVIVTLTTAMSAATPATVAATIAVPSGTATTQLNAYKTTVGGLLE